MEDRVRINFDGRVRILERAMNHDLNPRLGSFELGTEDEPMEKKATIYIETLTMPDGSKLGCRT